MRFRWGACLRRGEGKRKKAKGKSAEGEGQFTIYDLRFLEGEAAQKTKGEP